ncbi:hypothetical protein RJT34_01703 [Clitoria ternatea]|uniref:MYND-type domain-containing protein n=1 Tax=Clitoria ternatea TaxID=43366 RepID=A0AAN9KJS0_CLITE
MLVQGASSSLDLRYWLFELLGLREKTAPISDQSNTLPLLHHFILLLPIVVGFGWLLYQLPKNSETNPNAIEVDDQGEEGNLCDELDHYFQFDQLGEHQPLNGDGDDQHLSVQTAVPGGGDGRRHGACAFCGNLSTTRCSRCKAARYCSMKCQIRHWRSGHKNECCESESAADEANPSHDDGTSKLVKKSDRRLNRHLHLSLSPPSSTAAATTKTTPPMRNPLDAATTSACCPTKPPSLATGKPQTPLPPAPSSNVAGEKSEFFCSSPRKNEGRSPRLSNASSSMTSSSAFSLPSPEKVTNLHHELDQSSTMFDVLVRYRHSPLSSPPLSPTILSSPEREVNNPQTTPSS